MQRSTAILAIALLLAGAALPAVSALPDERSADAAPTTLAAPARPVDVRVVEPAELPPTTSAGIGPGSILLIGGVECTSNFVWSDQAGDLYLGTAGHCVTDGGPVHVCIEDCWTRTTASSLGVLATSSAGPQLGLCDVHWQDEEIDETWQELCRAEPPGVVDVGGNFTPLGDVAYSRDGGVGQDFALVEIPDALEDLVDPTMPVWGGPTDVFACETWVAEPGIPDEPPTEPGATQFYGHGIGFGEVWPEKARSGSFDTQFGCNTDAEWFRSAAPISFGDSGSAVNVVHAGADGTVTDRAALGLWTHLTATGPKGTLATQAESMVESDTALDVEIVTDPSPLES